MILGLSQNLSDTQLSPAQSFTGKYGCLKYTLQPHIKVNTVLLAFTGSFPFLFLWYKSVQDFSGFSLL